LIILGAFLALGIFVTFFISPQLRHYVPGAWQQQFLQQGYFPAEAALLELEVKAREIGEEAVAELAAGGGFINDSPCGVVEGVQLWNKGDQWCLPVYKENVRTAVERRLRGKLPGITEFGFRGKTFYGKGEQHTIWGNNISYIYRDNFAIALSHNVDDYVDIVAKAGELQPKCTQSWNLKICLEQFKPRPWQLGSCTKPWDGEGRQVAFCVEPYQWALDFSEEVTGDAAEGVG